jgi:2-polyprenyl-3-methyl-5-hydroxy-6-metoxy-1,4-benzoquinol methylase
VLKARVSQSPQSSTSGGLLRERTWLVRGAKATCAFVKAWTRIADNADVNSIAARLRRKRFNLFLEILDAVPETTPRPIRILDIGGTQRFWEVMGFTAQDNIQITLLNLEPQQIDHENLSSLVGDATDLLGIKDREFDIVFSNSVIEHVGNFDRQRRMAQEVQRVGQRYFVQTPNYSFPIEPHFLFLGFQWLPVWIRAFLVGHFRLGWMPRASNAEEARRMVEGIRLLTRDEFQALFPTATIYEEKFLGLTKSFVAYQR